MKFFLLLLVLPLAAQTVEEIAGRAAAAMARNDYAAAEEAYRQFLKKMPSVAEAQSNLGIACYFQEKYREAEQAFRQALKLQPGLFTPSYLLGQICFRQGRYEEALPMLEKAQRLRAEPDVVRLLAATLVGLKQYDRAARLSHDLLKVDANDIEALYSLGRIYMAMAEAAVERLKPYRDDGFAALLTAEHNAGYEQWRSLAIDSFKRAIDGKVALPGLRTSYAKLLILNKDWHGARAALEEDLRKDPASYEARFHLARVALATNSGDEAAKLIEEAVHIRPEFFRPLPELALPEGVKQAVPLTEPTRYPFSSAYLSGDSVRAENVRDAVLNRLTAAEAARESTGFDLIRRKRYEHGLRLLLEAPDRKPIKAGEQALVVHALFQLGRFEEIVEVSRDSSVPEVNYWLAQAYRQLAVHSLQKVAALDPDSARARQMLGDAFLAEGRYQEAAAEYDAALKREPGNVEIWYSLGAAYFRQMQYPLAVQAFDRVVQLDSRHAEAYLMRGDALVQMNENEKARQSLEKSLELDSRLLQAHILLGKVYGNAGDIQRARIHLEKGASTDMDGSVHYQLYRIYRRLDLGPEAANALKRSQELRSRQQKPTLESYGTP